LDQSPLIITLIAESTSNTGKENCSVLSINYFHITNLSVLGLFMNLGNNLLELTEPLVEAMKE
jgi:hypothetical protein